MGNTVKKVLLGAALFIVAPLAATFLLPATVSASFLLSSISLIKVIGISTALSAFSPDINTAGSRLLAANLSIFASPVAVRGIAFGRIGIAGQILFRHNIQNTGDVNLP